MVTPAPQADVLIIGAGIAGCAAAYHAARRGRRVVVIDAGIDCASTVPTALINPVRGYLARHSPDDVAGARASFALIDVLRAAGHPVVSGRGLWRPVPDVEQRDIWAAQLPGHIAHSWTEGHTLEAVLRGPWVATLYLPDSGWGETASLLHALRSESQAEFVTGEVVSVDAQRRSVLLGAGVRVAARELLWCGGAFGAARIAGDARFRPGSVLECEERLHPDAVSYGLYSAPHGAGSVVGPSTEAQYANYPPAWDAEGPEARLVERARKVFRQALTVRSIWRGVRLESATLPEGLTDLGRFGSRGYLLAPRAAALWAERL